MRTTHFRALNRAHAAAARAHLRFVVRRLTKAGVPTKAPLTEADWKLNAFAERADAEARVAELEKLNPNSKYAVIDL
ncbi:MAG TPA: hypothetical protein VFQ61_06435 [Polyangiaceae bacterium]|nr:hypothetical protein [Polyangiaceae bacterium]